MTRNQRDKRRQGILLIEHGVQVMACVRELIGPDNRGTPKKKWVNMTPTRYGHAVELLREGKYKPAVVEEACNLINASAWLQKPVAHVTDADVARLLREKPWETATAAKAEV